MLKMRTISVLGAALFLLAAGLAAAQPGFVPVCDLLVDNDGNCIADVLGQEVCIQGVVTSWKHFGTRGPGSIWDPESDCSISIYDITDAPDVAIGNLVEICGWMGNFGGLAEIVDNPADGTQDPLVNDLGVGPAFPIIDLKASELADFSALAEQKESFLVRLCGEFVATGDFASGTNYELMDPFGDICQVRIDNDVDLVGTPIPVGATEVLGILSQYNNFTDECVGYQVLPRFVGDVIPGDCETIATEPATWGGVKAMYR